MGPTAAGKTAMGLHIAQAFGGEIVSADSRQCYRQMTIGTAKPLADELAAVRHHFINHQSIHDPYNAGRFAKDATHFLGQYFVHNSFVTLVGGSGLYIDACIDGFDDLPSNSQLRVEIEQDYNHKGIVYLQETLEQLDSIYHQQIDLNNPQRLMRALEVCLASGKKYSDLRKNTPQGLGGLGYNIVWIGLNEPHRAVLYQRINDRVDKMVADGLVNEALHLYDLRHLDALKTVGYSELFEYFDKKTTLDEAIERIKTNTRRYAKRQLTWFRKRGDQIAWFEPNQSTEIINYIEQKILKRQ